MATPLPPEIIALRDRYQQAQIRLLEIIAEKEARGNLTAYRRGILDAVNAEIGNLDKFAREWVKSNIPRYYAMGASAAYKAFKDAGEDVARTAINTRVVQNLVDNATDMLIDAHQFVGRRIRDAVRQAGIEAIAEKVATGSTVKETKRRLIETLTKQGIPAVIDKRGRAIQLDSYAETVARTTTREATNKASIAEVEELGGDLVQMTQRFSTCPVCAVLEGRVYSISGNTPGYPPLSVALPNGYALPHPNCVVSGTLVLAAGVRAHSDREYVGEVVVIRVSGGDELTVTPNHPILTDAGWVAAGLVTKNIKVCQYIGGDGIFSGENPNDVYVPTVIEHVPHALWKTCGVTTVSVKTSTEQFHGDGTDGKIAVINTYCLLGSEINSAISEHVGEQSFATGVNNGSSLDSGSAGDQISFSSLDTTNGIVSGSSSSRPLFGCHSLGHDAARFCPCCGREYTAVFEPAVDEHFGNAIMSGDMTLWHSCVIQRDNLANLVGEHPIAPRGDDLGAQVGELYATNPAKLIDSGLAASDDPGHIFDSLTGKIQFADVIDVERKSFVGHVYNLHTDSGWYIANTIITHNCRHSFTPYFADMDASAEATQEMSNRPFDIDERAKASIAAYNREQKLKAARTKNRREWQRAKTADPANAPKTASAYAAMKRANSARYQELKKSM